MLKLCDIIIILTRVWGYVSGIPVKQNLPSIMWEHWIIIDLISQKYLML